LPSLPWPRRRPSFAYRREAGAKPSIWEGSGAARATNRKFR
jgi:hypothetical protein